MSQTGTCPECGEGPVYRHRYISSGSVYGPKLLPDLGGFGEYATFAALVCAHCGLTRLYADKSARAKLADEPGWTRMPD